MFAQVSARSSREVTGPASSAPSTHGRPQFRFGGRRVSGVPLPRSVPFSETGSGVHRLGGSTEELCPTAVHVRTNTYPVPPRPRPMPSSAS